MTRGRAESLTMREISKYDENVFALEALWQTDARYQNVSRELFKDISCGKLCLSKFVRIILFTNNLGL